MAGSSIAFADLYGYAGAGRKEGENAPPSSQAASGSFPASDDKAPAMYWVAMLGMLVAIRLLWEYGG